MFNHEQMIKTSCRAGLAGEGRGEGAHAHDESNNLHALRRKRQRPAEKITLYDLPLREFVRNMGGLPSLFIL